MNTPENSPTTPPGGRELVTSLVLLFVGTGLLALLQAVWPPVSGWLMAMLALLLFGIPSLVLRTSDCSIDDLGVHTGSWTSTAAWSLGTMLVIFPLFGLGHHVVMTTVMERESQWSMDSLRRWDRTMEGVPGDVCEDSDEAVIWIDSAGLWIMAPSGQALVLGGLQDQGRLVRCETERGPVATTPRRPASDGTMNLSPGTGVLLPLEDVDQVQLNLALTSGAMPAERIVTGAYREKTQEEGSLVATRGLLWLLPFLVVQLGLVALPEEWFFRGYLQGRMDQRWGTPWRLAGASIGPGLLVAALFFALLHPILIPGAHRLLVFFPALLFGWLKARNGHIGAAMVVHAGSNLLLEVLTGMYG